jgi:thioesterase DpgC
MTVSKDVDAGVVPTLAGEFATDRRVVSDYLGAVDDRLAGLPVPAGRDAAEQETAHGHHRAARTLRTRFLAVHAERVYDELTDGRTSRPRLRAVADTAAERFPGLVPSERQLADEARFIQADKEGREIDQGILFRALLAAPAAGTHLAESMLRPAPSSVAALATFRRTGEVVLMAARLDRRGAAAHLTITNDHCLNAEDNQHVADLETLVDVVLLDENTKVGVVRGATMTHPRYAHRRVFSAGINLKDLHAGRISLVDFLLGRELGYISKLMHGLVTPDLPWWASTVQKPWLAAVDAFAIGGGAQLLLAFDHVIAETDAYFSLPAANEGIVPGAANLRLTRFLGARPARRIIMGGARIGTSDPDGRRLFDDVVEPDGMAAAVDAAANQLAGAAVPAIRRMINTAEESLDDTRRYVAEFAVQQAVRAYSPDVLAKAGGTWRR